MPSIDHLVLACTDVDAMTQHLGSVLGVRPSPGGRHVGRGTRNTLLSFGDRSYLEVIGPDLEAPEPESPRPFGVDAIVAPGLAGWAVAVDDIDAVVARARAEGYDPGDPLSMQRDTPEGTMLSWRLTFAPAWANGVVPFLIDWGTTTHPSTTCAQGATLQTLAFGHPDTARVGAAFRALGIDREVRVTLRPWIHADISGPSGTIVLGL